MEQTPPTPAERDRDEQGRAKSTRPRDALGRPLPRDAEGDPELSRDPSGTPAELLAQGVDHFNAGRFFQAHECWETAWHPAPEAERDFWQGITQVAVGYTHRGRGNLGGAITLLRRGADRLESYGEVYRDLAVGALAQQARAAADALEQEGIEVSIPDPVVTLVGGQPWRP